jgi:hypothetical protein
MDYDLHNNVDDRVALDAQAIATNTTTVGNIIDTLGFRSLEFFILSKTITDGAYAIKLEEGEDAALSDAADVPAADVLGALTGFVAADDDTVKRVGSVGKKRYQRLSIVSTGVTTGVDIMGAVAVLGDPVRGPVAQ